MTATTPTLHGSALDELIDWLDEQAAARDVFLGAQVVAERGGTPFFEHTVGVDAEGVPLADRPLGLLRCAVSKPLLYLAIASLVQAGQIDLQATLGEQLDRPMHPETAALPLWTLMAHRAGLHQLTGTFLTLSSPEQQRTFVRTLGLAPNFEVGVDQSYAEAAGAVVLAELVEAITGEEYDQYYRKISPPEGWGDELTMRFDSETFASNAHRISVNGALDEGRVVPYLIERAPSFATVSNPGWSAYASSKGLAAMYRWWLDLWSGRRECPLITPATLDALFTPRWECIDPLDGASATGSSRLPNNEMSHGMYHGFETHGVPRRQTPNVFGHGGFHVSLGLADRDLDAVITMRFIGHTEHSLNRNLRCARVISGVYEAMGFV